MRWYLVAGAALVAGCVSVNEDVGKAGDVGADAVMLVGKIEIDPPIKPEEQKYQAGWDVFNTKRHFIGRAVLFTSDKPEYRERTGTALNPPLEQTFFVKLPKSQRYVVKGSVTYEDAAANRCIDVTYTAGEGFVDRGFGHVHRATAGTQGVEFYVVYLLPPGSATHVIPASAPEECGS